MYVRGRRGTGSEEDCPFSMNLRADSHSHPSKVERPSLRSRKPSLKMPICQGLVKTVIELSLRIAEEENNSKRLLLLTSEEVGISRRLL